MRAAAHGLGRHVRVEFAVPGRAGPGTMRRKQRERNGRIEGT